MAGMMMFNPFTGAALPAGAAAAIGGGFPPLPTPPACTTRNPRRRGVCCDALTTLGAARAAAGFTWTDCEGRLRCARCTVVPSQSKHHPGKRVFQYRAVAGCGAGCPALQG